MAGTGGRRSSDTGPSSCAWKAFNSSLLIRCPMASVPLGASAASKGARALPYRDGMTLLDVMIEVGGLTEFAAGNRAVLVRNENGVQKQYNVRLNDLIRDADLSANTDMRPGDILLIPESWF